MKRAAVYGVCDSCRLRHLVAPGSHELVEFFARHAGHATRAMSGHPLYEWLLDRFGWRGYQGNADVKEAFGTSTAMTCTLASLATGSARESTVVDNTSNLYPSALVYIAVKVGTVAAPKAVNIYAYGSEDGTNYTDPATGSDAGITIAAPTNLRPLGSIATLTNSGTYKSHPMAVEAAFGGWLPRKWGVVIENQSGANLDSTEGNHTKSYSGRYLTVV